MKKQTIYNLKNQNGIGLVEVIISLGVAIVVITSLVSLALFTVRTSTQSSLQLESTNYANREMELVRAYRDKLVASDPSSAWSGFTGVVGNCTLLNPCSMNSDGSQVLTGLSIIPATVTSPTPLQRGFTAIVGPTGNTVSIAVTISWTLGGQNKSTSVYTILSNWQTKQ